MSAGLESAPVAPKKSESQAPKAEATKQHAPLAKRVMDRLGALKDRALERFQHRKVGDRTTDLLKILEHTQPDQTGQLTVDSGAKVPTKPTEELGAKDLIATFLKP